MSEHLRWKKPAAFPKPANLLDLDSPEALVELAAALGTVDGVDTDPAIWQDYAAKVLAALRTGRTA